MCVQSQYTCKAFLESLTHITIRNKFTREEPVPSSEFLVKTLFSRVESTALPPTLFCKLMSCICNPMRFIYHGQHHSGCCWWASFCVVVVPFSLHTLKFTLCDLQSYCSERTIFFSFLFFPNRSKLLKWASSVGVGFEKNPSVLEACPHHPYCQGALVMTQPPIQKGCKNINSRWYTTQEDGGRVVVKNTKHKLGAEVLAQKNMTLLIK